MKGRKWDAVLDTSAFVPRIVKLSAELLADSVSHYVYVSSISAYASFAGANDESSPVGKIADETIEKVDENTYGPLKALCEQTAERVMPGRVTVLRPGYIVGPDDNSDRFTYWPARVARGGEVLAPNTPQDEIQVIDVRDLAAFTVLCMERRVLGTFNLVSAAAHVHHGRAAGRLLGRGKVRCAHHVGIRRFSRGAQGRGWRPAHLVACGRRERGLCTHQRDEGAGRRHEDPVARGYGARDPRVALVASGGAAGEAACGNFSRARAGAAHGLARGPGEVLTP